jgi:hypothetical protein
MKGTATLFWANCQINVVAVKQWPTTKDRITVTVTGSSRHIRHPKPMIQSNRFAQYINLMNIRRRPAISDHFLQKDDIRAVMIYNFHNTRQIVASIDSANTLMNVVNHQSNFHDTINS